MTNIFITTANPEKSFRSLATYLDTGEITEDVFVPSTGPLDWKPLLSNPEEQWKPYRSARATAHCWEDHEGFPPEVDTILRQSETLSETKPLLILPEWKVPLPGGNKPSQNDVWVLAKIPNGVVSIAIEGKAAEPFTQPLGKWKKNASSGKEERLEFLVSCLGLDSELPDHIYYQLIHRTASAIIMAEQCGAKAAVMLIHSFSPTNKRFSDYREFSRLFGIDSKIGVLGMTRAKNGLPLYLGWARGCKRYLSA